MLVEDKAIELLDVASLPVLVTNKLNRILGLVDSHLVTDLFTTFAYLLHFQLSFLLFHHKLLSLLANTSLILKRALDVTADFCARLDAINCKLVVIRVIKLIRFMADLQWNTALNCRDNYTTVIKPIMDTKLTGRSG